MPRPVVPILPTPLFCSDFDALLGAVEFAVKRQDQGGISAMRRLSGPTDTPWLAQAFDLLQERPGVD